MRTPEQSGRPRRVPLSGEGVGHHTVDLDAEYWPAGKLGGKAAGLRRAIDAGFEVPEGFVVLTDAFAAVVQRLVHRASTLAELREAIVEASLPSDLVEEIAARLQAAGPATTWAVRSSATGEDEQAQSFAGQQDTVLGVRGLDAVLDALRQVWASLYTEEALHYQVRMAVDAAPRRMAVVIQRMVDPVAAGVLFTRNPLGEDPTEAVVSATAGLGTAVVDGADSDTYYIEKPSGYVRERSLADTNSATLSPSALAELARIAEQVERAFDAPMDVEWALAREDGGRPRSEQTRKLYVLQVRPVTHGSSAPTSVWTNSNVGEALPGVATPLTWSILRNFSRRGFEQAFGSLGLEVPEEVELIGSFYGRIYLDLTEFARITSGVPILKPDALFAMAGGGGVELVRGIYEERNIGRFVRRLPATVARVTTSQLTLPLIAPLWERWFDRACEGFFGRDLERLNHRGLRDELDDVDSLFDRTGLILMSCSSNFLMSYVVTREMLQIWGSADAIRRERDLLAGLAVESAEPGLGLLELGRIARRSRRLRRIIGETPPAETLEALEAERPFQDVELFLEALDTFRHDFGHRAPREAEISTPRWREETSFLFEVLRGFLDSPHLPSPAEVTRDRRHARQEVERLVDGAVPGLIRPIFRVALELARINARLREALRGRVVDSLDMYRRFFLECGRRMARSGRLREADDVFYLTCEEIRGWLDDVSSARDFHLKVLVRRAIVDVFRQAPDPPDIFVLRGREMIAEDDYLGRERVVHISGEADELRGLPANGGRVTATARVVVDPSVRVDLKPGEVLVVPHADIGWTPLFLTASAVVIGLGGPLSHAAIVAREYGLPAVVNARGATATIRTGDLVTVDGDRGVVYVRRQ